MELLVRLKAWKPGFISFLLYSTDSSRGSKISVGSDSQYNPRDYFNFYWNYKAGTLSWPTGAMQMGFLPQPMDSVGAALLVCLLGRATEYWTSPVVLILQINSRIFVSYIKTAKYLLKNVKIIYFIHCMKFPYAF